MDCGIIIYSLFLVSVSGQNLYQDQISETRRKGQRVAFKSDFSASLESGTYELKIQSVKESHSATYYCACYKSGTHIFTVYNVKIFGTGTRLYVTDQEVQKPIVTIYPLSNPEPKGNTTLLCLAKDMFPDLVKISWKMRNENGTAEEMPQEEKKQLEQMDEGQTTSMIIIDGEKANVNKYICWVEHEVCNKPDTKTETVTESINTIYNLNLASLAYTVMIVKSLVFCCGFALLLQLRNMGSRPCGLTFN
ncbi:immunoglobulin lambda-1 light chain-like [Esox lucius]|uniref:immunoglobulin lambda-1 light chain-like n=1 Tax=Esox lucius TaxID=8010 RepID=UPI0014778421|nr:immunoglobulin lambda-1 light chain-like [Esox lucius]